MPLTAFKNKFLTILGPFGSYKAEIRPIGAEIFTFVLLVKHPN